MRIEQDGFRPDPDIRAFDLSKPENAGSAIQLAIATLPEWNHQTRIIDGAEHHVFSSKDPQQNFSIVKDPNTSQIIEVAISPSITNIGPEEYESEEKFTLKSPVHATVYTNPQGAYVGFSQERGVLNMSIHVENTGAVRAMNRPLPSTR